MTPFSDDNKHCLYKYIHKHTNRLQCGSSRYITAYGHTHAHMLFSAHKRKDPSLKHMSKEMHYCSQKGMCLCVYVCLCAFGFVHVKSLNTQNRNERNGLRASKLLLKNKGGVVEGICIYTAECENSEACMLGLWDSESVTV